MRFRRASIRSRGISESSVGSSFHLGAVRQRARRSLRGVLVTDASEARKIAVTGYEIIIQRGAIDSIATTIARAAPAFRYAIVTDSNVGKLYAQKIAAAISSTVDVITVPAGETTKTRESWIGITDRMLSLGLGRDSAIIALGGGMIGDLAGFVAATYMRGVPFIQIPTSLLAMLDASVGAKTGVDTPAGKNLVGSFYRPAIVIIDQQLLATLPLNHLRAGLTEAIKCGAVADRDYFDWVAGSPLRELLAPDGWRSKSLLPLIARSVEIKAAVVADDEREAGRRRILNFGHTIGHAVEEASSYSLLHGEAVAIGMVLESRLAEKAGIAEPGTAVRIQEAVVAAGLPIRVPAGIAIERVIARMSFDKKARSGHVEFALPRRIGAMYEKEGHWSVAVDEALVKEVLS
jgi:3-dehydroquinate synthase